MNIYKITRPVLQVYINNKIISQKIHKFTLSTDMHHPYCIPELELSQKYTGAKKGDTIKIILKNDNTKYVLFSGYVHIIIYEIGITFLSLIDDFVKIWKLLQPFSYRKEKASNILIDILEKAGVTAREITCPDVVFERFSSYIPANEIIKVLIGTLKKYGYDEKYRFFFDSENVFRFGTINDTAINPGERFVLKSGINILTKKDNCITTVALPVRHSQEIEVDGKAFLPHRTELIISSDASRIRIWGEESV